ncbi:Gfo/Idh/MocA family oxidoreductase [Paenibacillus profundus]|uniref:Gfo/Idh/MocA family oxidoreductase n=1 Tax=Paenibacillus profundus TaxID=1173085 RepID=A0ABS8YMK6_9BACL|nr:Gfo/Idh/MocA family oxidoreductase [Paenibacillus profundus]MCE5172204.1 Gfo/Idh/MocA family oxidoreductase [Paenibacillus profundus]
MIRVAILSYWHVHAEEYTEAFRNHPETEVVALWDENVKRGASYADKYGVECIPSLDELLSRTDIDAVVVTTPTTMHEDVIARALRAKKHVFTEKVLSVTGAGAEALMAEATMNNVILTVALRRRYESEGITIERLVKEGTVGQPTLIRVRMAHNGATAGWLPEHFYSLEECGGGAMIDLGCHPMYLIRLLAGIPQAVTAAYGYMTKRKVEDHAAALLHYDSGVIGIAETGFVTGGSPYTIEVHGTEGSLLFTSEQGKDLLTLRGADGTVKHIPLDKPEGSMFDEWVNRMLGTKPEGDNTALAIDLSRIMEATNESARIGGTVRI